MTEDVVSLYRRQLDRRGFVADSPQWRAVERLQQLFEEWSAYKARRSSALKRLIVKPALPYLDVLRRIKDDTGLPVAAYNVSGEYSMIRAAGINGWLDEERATMEVLTSIKRAGADLILTYFAKEVARKLRG